MNKLLLGLFCLPMAAGLASANEEQHIPLQQYLDSMNYQKVTVEGGLFVRGFEKEVNASINDGVFPVALDTGRQMRERVEKECSVSGFGDEFCDFSGKGTIELRGSRIWISLEEVTLK